MQNIINQINIYIMKSQSYLKKTPFYVTFAFVATFILSSCGTYQSVYNNDGIYDDEVEERIVITENRKKENVAKESYFKDEINTFNNDIEDETFIDSTSYDDSNDAYWNQSSDNNNPIIININTRNRFRGYWDFYDHDSYWSYQWGFRNGFYGDYIYYPYQYGYYNNFRHYSFYYNPFFYNNFRNNRFYNNNYNRNYTYTKRGATRTNNRRGNSVYRRSNTNYSNRRSSSINSRIQSVLNNSSRRSSTRTNNSSPIKNNTSTRRTSTSNKKAYKVNRRSSSNTNNASSVRSNTSSNRNSSVKSSSRTKNTSSRRKN